MMNNITEPQCLRLRTSISFVLIILFFSFSNIFCFSGAAEIFHYNEILCFVFVLSFCFLLTNKKRIDVLGTKFSWFIVPTMLIFIAVLTNYDASRWQIINFVSTFGCIMFVQLFSSFRWERKNLVKLGIPCSLFGVILTWLFLPGHALSGWNSNSSIISISIVLLGLSFLWTSPKKKWHILLYVIALAEFSLISSLENRSSILALLVFVVSTIMRKCFYKKNIFRIIYISIILINVAIPFLNVTLSNFSSMQDIIDVMSSLTDEGKTGESLFNGREELWNYGIMLIGKNPILGCYGIRPIYPHNFSLDLLIEFGTIGWIAFFAMVIFAIEKAFKENSDYNIFLVAFVCFVLLNTFENVLVCCNTFSFFYCLFIAITLRINTFKHLYEKSLIYYG